MNHRLTFAGPPMQPEPFDAQLPPRDPKAYLPPKWMGNHDIPEAVKKAAERKLKMQDNRKERCGRMR